MNKAELIELISEKAELTKTAADRALTAMLGAIGDSLQKDESVVLGKLGTLVVRKRAARDGRNPQTGEKIKIKASKTVGFKPAKALKDALKEA